MSDAALLVVAAVLLIVVVSAIAPRIRIAPPVLMVLAGIGCSYIPGLPAIEIEPEWFLMIVLPPLLYAAAVAMPTTDFRRDFKTIGALSVGLVVVSALVSGLVINWLFPPVSLPMAIALGAVISPPDAVAATSVGKRLGLPNRLVTILEGEGLVNDATALVLLRTALGATAGFSVLGVAGDFFYAVLAGSAIGVVVGFASVWLRAKIDQPVLATSISFVVPFISYIPAEEIHASGVLAVVVAGLITGAKGAKRFTPHDRMTDRTNWRTIAHLLESGVFLLMGYQLHFLIDDVLDDDLDVWHAIGIGLIATLVLILVRILFVIPVIAGLKRSQRRGAEQVQHLEEVMGRLEEHGFDDETRKDRTERFLRRRHADASFYANEGLGWRGGAVIAWAGMRGAVTLAAAQSLPHDVPYRSALMLVAFTVAIVTLVVQGATLPLLIGALGVRGTSKEEEEARELAILLQELRVSASDMLDSESLHRHDGQPFDPEVVEAVRARALAQLNEKEERDWDAAPQRLTEGLELQRLILDAEQAALLDARASGTYRSSTINRAQHLLDINATRFDGQSGGH